jgi:hypothetical protein
MPIRLHPRLALFPALGKIPVVKRALLPLVLISSAFAADAPIPAKIAYNRDVRPILADTCFKCHGFDKNKRKADLRLDVREAALAKIDDIFPIVPGKPEESEAWKRIITKDEDDVMPPKDEHRQLSARDREVIRKWIEQGAEYQPHWAYVAPVAADVRRQADQAMTAAKSARRLTSSATNPVDAFIAARHVQLGLVAAPEADPATLCRRLCLDITGLPPKPAEVDAFVQSAIRNPQSAIESLVDHLLASEHYGERMAVWWLDLVRYADTTGYHSDNARNVWPYRDYVIRAFNGNKRFDRFTVEQVAGDLLPGATQEQKVASAYNRLTLTTEEGGAQAKEYEAKSVTDRVKSIGTTWLAQTFMCAECHDHKFDPFTTRDFYSLGAFFADIKESAIGRREEGMPVTTPEHEARLKDFDKRIAALQVEIDAPSAETDRQQAEWEKQFAKGKPDVAWTALHVEKVHADRGSKLEVRDGGVIENKADDGAASDTFFVTAKLPAGAITGIRLDALADDSLPKKGPGRAANGNFVLNEFTVKLDDKPQKIASATATFEQKTQQVAQAIDGKAKDVKNGWGVLGNAGRDASAYFELAESLTGEKTVVFELRQKYGDRHTLGKFRILATTAPKPVRAPNADTPADIAALIEVPAGKRTPAQAAKLASHFRSVSPQLEPLRKKIAAAQVERTDFEKTIPRCIVSEHSEQYRTVRILPRGDWMNDKGEVVSPATPAYLPGAPKPAAGARLSRLDLGNWLVGRGNPLTARVFVNRLWKQFYGLGLVKTLEDLGTQGELPANEPLLDWLAVEFMDSGWDVKHMVRLMTTCGVYRQSGTAPKDTLQRDPYNREIARQGRWRLDAEFVRDNALSIAGLMVHKIGGPSVKPYQPDGYWENLNFPVRKWEADNNENQWRRGLYVWWQRSYVHPAMLAFDAPTREECAADRTRSNIPQQALVLLNDPEFVEAARAFAARILKEGGPTPESRIAWAWREATGRAAKPVEIEMLRALLERQRAALAQQADAAGEIIKVGYAPAPAELSRLDLVSYTAVARAILNLHETVTRL